MHSTTILWLNCIIKGTEEKQCGRANNSSPLAFLSIFLCFHGYFLGKYAGKLSQLSIPGTFFFFFLPSLTPTLTPKSWAECMCSLAVLQWHTGTNEPMDANYNLMVNLKGKVWRDARRAWKWCGRLELNHYTAWGYWKGTCVSLE